MQRTHRLTAVEMWLCSVGISPFVMSKVHGHSRKFGLFYWCSTALFPLSQSSSTSQSSNFFICWNFSLEYKISTSAHSQGSSLNYWSFYFFVWRMAVLLLYKQIVSPATCRFFHHSTSSVSPQPLFSFLWTQSNIPALKINVSYWIKWSMDSGRKEGKGQQTENI